MEEQLWLSEIKRSALFGDPTALVEKEVGIWNTNHRSKVFGVSVSYETKKKFLEIFRVVTATITYRKLRK